MKMSDKMSKVYLFVILIMLLLIDFKYKVLFLSLYLIILSVFGGAMCSLQSRSTFRDRLQKGVSVLLLLYGIILFFGVLMGHNSMIRPLNSSTVKIRSLEKIDSFLLVKSRSDLKEILRLNSGKRIMLDFYAEWCVSCKEFDEVVLTDSGIKNLLSDVVMLRVDVTKNSDEDKALLRQFNLYGPPGIVFFGSKGIELSRLKVVGYKGVEAFSNIIKQL